MIKNDYVIDIENWSYMSGFLTGYFQEDSGCLDESFWIIKDLTMWKVFK